MKTLGKERGEKYLKQSNAWLEEVCTLSRENLGSSKTQKVFVIGFVMALAAWILFSEVPDIWTWIGGTIIFSSTAYISHREVLLSRSQKPNQGFKETKF